MFILQFSLFQLYFSLFQLHFDFCVDFGLLFVFGFISLVSFQTGLLLATFSHWFLIFDVAFLWFYLAKSLL